MTDALEKAPDPVPRTKEQINAEYTECCLQLGDLKFKMAQHGNTIGLIKSKVEELMAKMTQLSTEVAAPPAEANPSPRGAA